MLSNLTSWKGFFVERSIQRLIKSKKFASRVYVYIHSRRSTIGPAFIGRTVYVYNGRKFFNTKIVGSMIGHKFGEFSVTKRLGAEIHESIRTKKRRAKLKRKL
jgi:small subunit ribosomal protein S19